jgi:hypothetical protein
MTAEELVTAAGHALESPALTVLILPTIGFVAGYFAKWLLQRQKARDDLRKALVAKRAKSLTELWRLTSSFAAGLETQATQDKRCQIDRALSQWYFNEGGALFLSWKSAYYYLRAVECLRKPASTGKRLKKRFSRLRTALKRDLGIYTAVQAWLPLPTPGDPLVQPQVATVPRSLLDGWNEPERSGTNRS